MRKYFSINRLGKLCRVNSAERSGLQSPSGKTIFCGVLSAISRILTVLQKAICEQLLYYYITAFCMVHGRWDRKAVLCRP